MERGLSPASRNRALRFLAAFCLLLASLAAMAETPIAVAAPRKARAKIVDVARSWLGTPYSYGGASRDGIDCSGLVYRVYIDCFGSAPTRGLPRSALSLFSFVEAIPDKSLEPGDLVFFNTTGKLSHVGIYEGEGLFIHAASDGSKTGVIESRLDEKYWAAHFAGSGRIIPPARYLGLILTASLGPSVGSGLDFRGIDASCELSYRLSGLEAGLELRPSWDSGLSVFRLPLVLSISLDRNLRLFAGPALTLGSPSMSLEGRAISYAASGGWLATAGIAYSPFRFRIPGGGEAGLYFDLVYDRYVALSEADVGSGISPRLRAGAGLKFRYGF